MTTPTMSTPEPDLSSMTEDELYAAAGSPWRLVLVAVAEQATKARAELERRFNEKYATVGGSDEFGPRPKITWGSARMVSEEVVEEATATLESDIDLLGIHIPVDLPPGVVVKLTVYRDTDAEADG